MPKKTMTKKTKTKPVKKTTTRKPAKRGLDAKVAFEELRERLSRVEATLVDLVDLLYKLSEESEEEPEEEPEQIKPDDNDHMMVVTTFTENDRVDVDGDVIDVG